MKQDDFGDRMKGYEAAEDTRLDPALPIYVRLDGRSFSRFTRGMERPFDPRMTEAMIQAAQHLVGALHPRIGYVQSDEISLLWQTDRPEAEPLFGARSLKLASICASLATAAFNHALPGVGLGAFADRLPHFDGRVANLPTRTEAANMMLWRERDAAKNAVSMAAHHHLSPKALHGKSTREMRAMLAGVGVEIDAFPCAFRRGTFLRRVNIMRQLTADELAAIPERHRPTPDAWVTRTEVRAVPMPDFHLVANREAVIFDHAEPELREAA